jgi:putative Mn2+ efflux pump MntP
MELIINSLGLGIGLAVDAFSVSLADGLSMPKMKRALMLKIAAVFAIFQGLMPLIGWICVHTVQTYFEGMKNVIPWIALILLSYIGAKMVFGAIFQKEAESQSVTDAQAFGLRTLLLQGIATSIDALSTGFTIADYGIWSALICVAIIAVVTFGLCLLGTVLGKRGGIAWSRRAELFGGVILIAIGVKIIVSHYLG